MQLQNDRGSVTAVGVVSQSKFSIAKNGKAFRVLSDTLYQNKIGSIVRELSCNALDSHIMAGKDDVPFELHLPDVFEPWFTVIDNGLGLTHDDIENVYTQYFNSTKDQSNDVVGAFGLGSKTPFSYTDSFTIVSRYDGMRRTYAAFVDTQDEPTVNLMEESETNEPNGLEVQIAVKPGDITRFRDEVIRQLHFFKVKPIIHNCPSLTWNEPHSVIIETEKFSLYAHGSHHIIQGQVGYPLDMSQVLQGADDENKKFISSVISGRSLHLHFDIGQIEVTASREGVQYRDFTLKNINDRLTECREELKKHVVDKINGFATDWERVQFINSDPFLKMIATNSGVVLNNVVLSGGLYYYNVWDLVSVDKKVSTTAPDGTVTEVVQRVPTALTQFYGRTKSVNARVPYTVERGRYNSLFDLAPVDNKFKILIRDSTSRPVLRINEFCAKHDLDRCFVIQPRHLGTFGNIDAFITKLTAALGGFADIHKVSDLPEPVRTVQKRTGYSRPTCYIYDQSAARSRKNNIHTTKEWPRGYEKLDEMPDGGYYVMVERHAVYAEGDALSHYLTMIRNGRMLDKPLVAVRENDIAKIKDNPEWIPLKDATDAEIEDVKNDHRMRRAVLASQVFNAIHHPCSYTFLAETLPALNKHFPKDHPLNRMERFYRAARKGRERYAECDWMVNLVDFEMDDATVQMADTITDLKNMYPLVSDMFNRYHYMNLEHIALYINAVDARNAQQGKYLPQLKLAA